MRAEPLDAVLEMSEFFSSHHIRYVLIGGLAVQFWGQPRLTVDADFTIPTPLEEGSASLVQLITGHFPSRIQNSFEFARHQRMILITASNGVDVDISLALPGYEDEMLARAVEYELELGKSIRLCSAEDLIIHKAVAGRPQDVVDIQGIVYRQGDKLDVQYIRGWLEQFAAALDEPEVQERFERAWWSNQEDQATPISRR